MRSGNSKKEANENSQGFPFSEKDIRRVLGSPAGQQLLNLLTRSSGNELQRAAEAFKQGDMEAAKAILSPLMNSPEAASLVDEINRT